MDPPKSILNFMKRLPRKNKLLLGLTGSFGSGKSTVAGMLGSFGAQIIDADKIAHLVYKPNADAYRKIVDCFGKGILRRDKRIDRKKLSLVVFKSESSLRKLNAIVHPQVIRVIREKLKAASKPVVVLDAPLLIEVGLTSLVDKLIVVKISRKLQMERVSKRTGLARERISRIIKAQMSLADKVRLADFVIDNSGNIAATKKQVKQMWEKFSGV
jgi:dephospho-CoA kinase